MFDLNFLLRQNIASLIPYSCARDEYKLKNGVFLDANENAYKSPAGFDFNRYPDPLQIELKRELGRIKSISPDNIFLGNGSDEAIDLVYRVFCEPNIDNVIICPPTYGMYQVYANINNVNTQLIPLLPNTFQLNIPEIKKAINKNTKLLFICSPNNPTGNLMHQEDLYDIIQSFKGIVVLDEAYHDFANTQSSTTVLNTNPNLIILQTLSKAWGMASLRLGIVFASKEIINYFNKVKPPYNISGLTQKTVLQALKKRDLISKQIIQIQNQRAKLTQKLLSLAIVEQVYPSDSNFLLVKIFDASAIYTYLIYNKIITRNRSNILLCNNCLRITIGTTAENIALTECLKAYNLSELTKHTLQQNK